MSTTQITCDERDLILAGLFELTITHVEDDDKRERCKALAAKLGGDLPETLYGAGVVEDANIPNHGSAVKSVVFGDFNRGYLVYDAGLRIERSDDYAFANDLASFRAVWRLDGVIRDNNAIGVYQATANEIGC